MDLLSVIRRWRHRDKLGNREIARRTGLSRNTIRKYLASGVVEPKYPPRTSPSKLDSYTETLSSWLKRESRRNRKQRRNLKQLYHDLVVLGYQGSYDRVAAFMLQPDLRQPVMRTRARRPCDELGLDRVRVFGHCQSAVENLNNFNVITDDDARPAGPLAQCGAHRPADALPGRYGH